MRDTQLTDADVTPCLMPHSQNVEWLLDNRVTYIWRQLVARILLDLVIAQACAIISGRHARVRQA
jgi:hypothetical protein